MRAVQLKKVVWKNVAKDVLEAHMGVRTCQQRHLLMKTSPFNRNQITARRIQPRSNPVDDALADLAAEFIEAVRAGKEPNLSHYLSRCPDAASRREFKTVIAMSALLTAAYAVGEKN